MKRIGKKRQPFYRIVVLDRRAKRDGRVIEDLGFYQPWLKKKTSKLDMTRYKDWISKGALPTPTVKKLYLHLSKPAEDA